MSIGNDEMNIKSLSNHAMTLTELIVASVLVGIVTLGLVAAEQAVRMSRQSSNRDAQISAQMQAAMMRISKDSNSTVGDFSNTGIYQYAVVNDITICFRHANGDANSYTDDLWNCWWANRSSRALASCENLVNPVTTCAGQASLLTWTTLTFEGTYQTFYSVFDVTDGIVAPAGANITNTKISYIQIDLRSRPNPTLPEHPIENPNYRLTSRISPAGLSR